MKDISTYRLRLLCGRTDDEKSCISESKNIRKDKTKNILAGVFGLGLLLILPSSSSSFFTSFFYSIPCLLLIILERESKLRAHPELWKAQ
jgi:hypothetical protein